MHSGLICITLRLSVLFSFNKLMKFYVNLCAFRNSNIVRIWVGGWSVNHGLFKLEMGEKARALKIYNSIPKCIKTLLWIINDILYGFGAVIFQLCQLGTQLCISNFWSPASPCNLILLCPSPWNFNFWSAPSSESNLLPTYPLTF